MKAVDSTTVRPYNTTGTSIYITVVCRRDLASHLDHKQQEGVSLSNKVPAVFQPLLFAHPIEEFQAMARQWHRCRLCHCRWMSLRQGTGFLWLPDNSHKVLPRAGVYVNRQDVSHPR